MTGGRDDGVSLTRVHLGHAKAVFPVACMAEFQNYAVRFYNYRRICGSATCGII
jgi:hypothetical protein